VRLWAITAAIAISALCLGGCSKRTEHDVFDLPCGPGRLVLHEDHLATFETTYVTFELRYIEGKNVRPVDKLKRRARPYLALPQLSISIISETIARKIPGQFS
jgi:hypothetical protein